MASSGRPLRFDFAVFDDEGNIDFLVEAQGSQHYQVKNGNYSKLKTQKYNDTQKRMYCYKHNIPLVYVEYHEIHSITLEELHDKYVKVYAPSISNAKDLNPIAFPQLARCSPIIHAIISKITKLIINIIIYNYSYLFKITIMDKISDYIITYFTSNS